MHNRIIAAVLAASIFISGGITADAAAKKVSSAVQAIPTAEGVILIPQVDAAPQIDPALIPAPAPVPVMPQPAPAPAPVPVPTPMPEPVAMPAPVAAIQPAVTAPAAPPAPAQTPEAALNAAADQVLAGITTPSMSAVDKAKAIYNWTKKHVRYAHQNNHSDYIAAATTGITKGRGDCYIYYATARILLTRAGIPNMEIHKIPAKTEHYWNLVNVGSGWLHFDTTPRKDDRTFFLWTDSQLMDYSNSHNKSHNYDRNVYTGITP